VLDLPRKDKAGNSYLSYSQLTLFKRSPQEYFEQYILEQPFEGNAYTDFGTKVGEALENNDFKGFPKIEKVVLKKVRRLDEFERKIKLDYKDFYVTGYVDTNSSDFKEIIDYKTGGKKKETQYQKSEYTQLCIYALGLRQETGVTPEFASVEFIRRGGNAFRGQKLFVEDENPLSIKVDISEKRLKAVYRDIFITAKQIEHFFKANKTLRDEYFSRRD
jgi:hypothetical protein